MERKWKALLVGLIVALLIAPPIAYQYGRNSLAPELQQIKNKNQELKQTLEQELQASEQELKSLKQELAQTQAKIQALEQEIQQAQELKQALEQELQRAQEKIQELEEELKQLKEIERVAIIVDESIESKIQDNLNQYIADIEFLYRNVRITQYAGSWKNQAKLRAFIQDLYYDKTGISGVILVGTLPYAIWEYFPGDIAPLPYYYEDLDGSWEDQNSDGILDYHFEEEQKPEIWVSWIRPYSNNVAQSINEYLQKSHCYYSGNMRYQNKAFVAVDKDWGGLAPEITSALLQIYPETGIVTMNGSLTGISPEQYLEEYIKQYEITDVWSHSDNDQHEFERGDLTASTIKSLKNGSKITMIWGCHAADFYKAPYKGDLLASSYVYNEFGMACIAATRSIGIENHEIIIDSLAQGDTLGKAFLTWISYSYNQSFIETRFPDENTNQFMWGFILIGDPFIKLDKYQPYC